MKKKTKEFYKEIYRMLQKEHPIISLEFQIRIKNQEPKEIFLWLEKELKNKTSSSELDDLMTDFFYSIH